MDDIFILGYTIAPHCYVYFVEVVRDYVSCSSDKLRAYIFKSRSEALEQACFLKAQYGVDFDLVKYFDARSC